MFHSHQLASVKGSVFSSIHRNLLVIQGITANKAQENKEFNLMVISVVKTIKVNESAYIWKAGNTDFADTVKIIDKK